MKLIFKKDEFGLAKRGFLVVWKEQFRKLYIYTERACYHFGRLNGRWSYGVERH